MIRYVFTKKATCDLDLEARTGVGHVEWEVGHREHKIKKMKPFLGYSNWEMQSASKMNLNSLAWCSKSWLSPKLPV